LMKHKAAKTENITNFLFIFLFKQRDIFKKRSLFLTVNNWR